MCVLLSLCSIQMTLFLMLVKESFVCRTACLQVRMLELAQLAWCCSVWGFEIFWFCVSDYLCVYALPNTQRHTHTRTLSVENTICSCIMGRISCIFLRLWRINILLILFIVILSILYDKYVTDHVNLILSFKLQIISRTTLNPTVLTQVNTPLAVTDLPRDAFPQSIVLQQ